MYIILDINSKQYSISIDITNDLLEFLYNKITNCYNRIELYIHDDEENVRVIEILKGDVSLSVIEMSLDRCLR